ncbi:MAG: hypothetical protein QXJ64_08610 [Thermosphaera sp.]
MIKEAASISKYTIGKEGCKKPQKYGATSFKNTGIGRSKTILKVRRNHDRDKARRIVLRPVSSKSMSRLANKAIDSEHETRANGHNQLTPDEQIKTRMWESKNGVIPMKSRT